MSTDADKLVDLLHGAMGAVTLEAQELIDVKLSPNFIRHLQDEATKAAWAVLGCGLRGYAEGLGDVSPPWEREPGDE